MTRALTVTLAIVATLALAGCAYDYLQRSDKIAFSAGDAVAANREGSTTDPANPDAYDTDGLGKNGPVIVVTPDP